MSKIYILDSTLRDGAQGEGVSFSIHDKLATVEYLDSIGVDYIEAGNPSSNPKDFEFFKKIKKVKLKNSKIVAFTSTHRIGIKPQDDSGLKDVLEADTEYVSVFGKSWDMHVTEILNTELKTNLDLIKSTISYLTQNNIKVFFDAEHFYDGYKANKEYAIQTLHAAKEAGAVSLILCDTNGASFPFEIEEITSVVKKEFPDTEIGIHAHNDVGMADANSLFAVRGGATHIQGTFGGLGERCGNANLCTIICNLQIKLGYEVIGAENVKAITKASRSVFEAANFAQPTNLPFVGLSAFTHKGGMHCDAVAKNPKSYEHIDPNSVGNKRRILMSEVAGRSAILPSLKLVEPSLSKNSEKTRHILEKLKEMEHLGYDYDGAEGSAHLLFLRELGKFTPHFAIKQFNVVINEPSYGHSSIAMVKIAVDGRNEVTAAQGDGPVDALDRALRKALEVFYPQIKKVELSDYKVRVLGSGDGTASRVRVLITSSDGINTWRTVGVSTDIIDASRQALVDSLEYYLY